MKRMDLHWVVLLGVFAVGFGATGASGQLPPVPVPPENPMTEQKIVLGKILFWEEQMSSDNTVACGTCHLPEFGGSDPRTARTPGLDGNPFTPDDVFGSPGVIRSDSSNDYEPDPVHGFLPQVTGRLSPSFVGAMYFPEIFWEGRAGSAFDDPQTGDPIIAAGGALENQASGPPVSSVEMAHAERSWDQITVKLETAIPMALATNVPSDMQDAITLDPTYPELFEKAFGDTDITAARIAMAIASYERTLVPDQTPWDDFNQGDLGALTANEQAGLALFEGVAGCSECHVPPFFSDDLFHNIGLRPNNEDVGRFEITADPLDMGSFKTASLRNVGVRPRFMHNGGFSQLRSVVDFYDRGGDFHDNQDELIVELNLTAEERDQLTEFMEFGLTDPRVAAATFPFDRPTLHSELNPPNPSLFGADHPGSGGSAPTLIANSPPNLGNPSFRLGIHGGLGGAKSVLGVSNEQGPPGQEFNGVPVHISLSSPTPRRFILFLNGAGPGEGYGTLEKPLPSTPGLLGETFYAQWFVKDPGAAGGISATQGAELTIF